MRLIDADMLIHKRSHAKVYSPEMYVIGQGYVMDAPTIEAMPVVHGEWIEQGFGEFFACSECEYLTREYLTDFRLSKYCPNCGSKMVQKGNKGA